MHQASRVRCVRNGLSLVDSLAVIAITVLGIALITPTLSRAATDQQRVSCAKNVRRMTQATLIISELRRGTLFPADSNLTDRADLATYRYTLEGKDANDHVSKINPLLFVQLLRNDVSPNQMYCPNREELDKDRFDKLMESTDTPQAPIELGYFYLAARPNRIKIDTRTRPTFGPVTDTPRGGQWESALKITQRPRAKTFAIIADRNELGAATPDGAQSTYSHGEEGLFLALPDQRFPPDFVAGCNTGFFDGSVKFETFANQREYQVNAAGSETNRGYWSASVNVEPKDESNVAR